MASATEGMAPSDSTKGEPTSPDRAMPLEGLNAVVRARWAESTPPAQKMPQGDLIEAYQANQGLGGQGEEDVSWCGHVSTTVRITDSRCRL